MKFRLPILKLFLLEVLKVMEPFLKKLKHFKELIGNSSVDLTTKSQQESNLGDVVTDSFRAFPWNDIGLLNTSIPVVFI